MARPLRIEFDGALYHVMSRGNERRPIVRDDDDRRRRLDWLERTVETYGWRLHAFALVENHEHLFVETPRANLGVGMQFLNGSYTSYFNRRHARVGHLFQGRYKAQLVESEGYFRNVSRYIHLNPVRAGLVRRLEDWRWSSYPGYRRASRILPWVTYDAVLGDFSSEPSDARKAYARFVGAGITSPPPSPFEDAVRGLILGSAAFVDRMRRLLDDRPKDAGIPALAQLRPRPSLEEIGTAVAEVFGVAREGWQRGRRVDDPSRAVAAYLARRRYGYGATEIAAAFAYRRPSSVSQAITRIEADLDQLTSRIAAVLSTL